MDKNVFQGFKEINEGDIKNGTKNLAVSPYFLRGNMTKKGGEITMGIDGETFMRITNGEMRVVLICVDNTAYEQAFKD